MYFSTEKFENQNMESNKNHLSSYTTEITAALPWWMSFYFLVYILSILMHSFCFTNLELYYTETSLVVQWLRLHASTVEGTGLTLDWGTKISHALWCG